MKQYIIKYLKIVAISLSLITVTSCIDDSEFSNTPQGNFNAIWQTVNDHYCFFSYKDIDWDGIYSEYYPQVSNSMSEVEFFDLMDDMLAELQDGHVNLYSSFNTARYWAWFEDYLPNYNEYIVNQYYLQQPNYMTASGVKYRILEGTNIGYLYYGSFSTTLSNSTLDDILSYFSGCDGIIVDVRDNTGGSLSNVHTLFARFISTATTTSYIRHKLSAEHNDFSDYYPVTISPASSSRTKFFKPIALLTNRSCYSATNDFVVSMKPLSNVTIIGDRTGGGSGLPFTYVMPNGWVLRLSASPVADLDYNDTEFGIDPTIFVDNDESATTSDKIIDTAVEFLTSANQ